jgi:putative endonuclease|uniref:GIY-YIG nuclease family protein n=1 Tax=Algoriphagus sp. TaxID=1872435 RepID=UPI00258F0A8F|nr:GIY-YIG nuclease family protein [Algoriphagus sp.]
MYYVYILFSSKTNKFYIGSTDNLNSRLNHHNSGATPSTKSGAPFWEIKYHEIHPDRSEALKRELEIKKKKSKRYIEWLISFPKFFGTRASR